MEKGKPSISLQTLPVSLLNYREESGDHRKEEKETLGSGLRPWQDR